MRITIFVSQGTRPPWWAGLVYRDYMRDAGVYTLMPFHHFLRLARNLYYWFKFPTKLSTKELCDLAVAIALDRQKAEYIAAIRNLDERDEVYICGDAVPEQIIKLLKEINKELNDITSTNQ